MVCPFQSHSRSTKYDHARKSCKSAIQPDQFAMPGTNSATLSEPNAIAVPKMYTITKSTIAAKPRLPAPASWKRRTT